MSDNLALQQVESAQMEHVEQSASMMQQLATAQIQSRYLVAIKRPRNLDAVRQKMLEECKRPDFCLEDPTKHGSSMAIYSVPRGNKKDADGNWVPNLIAGPTIRFAEMALRYWGNLSVDVVPLGEDANQRIYQVTATDFESNVTGSQIVVVPKIVERSSNKDGLPVLSQRTNSYGKPVYTLQATEEEVSMKANALISKARRNLILQCLPAWIVEDCVQQVRATAAAKDAEAPDAAKRRLYDAFGTVGVTVEQLTEYIGHSNPLTPAEMETLRGLYSGIKEGAATWSQIMAEKGEQASQDDTVAQIDKLFAELGATKEQARKDKGRYAGRSKELLGYLQEQVVKKRNTGAAQQDAEKQPAKEADTATKVTGAENIPSSTTAGAAEKTSSRSETTPASTTEATQAETSTKTSVEPKTEPTKPSLAPEPLNTGDWD